MLLGGTWVPLTLSAAVLAPCAQCRQEEMNLVMFDRANGLVML